MKTLFVFVSSMMLSTIAFSSASFFQDILEIETSCGVVWHIDMDKVPQDTTAEELVAYFESVDALLCGDTGDN